MTDTVTLQSKPRPTRRRTTARSQANPKIEGKTRLGSNRKANLRGKLGFALFAILLPARVPALAQIPGTQTQEGSIQVAQTLDPPQNLAQDAAPVTATGAGLAANASMLAAASIPAALPDDPSAGLTPAASADSAGAGAGATAFVNDGMSPQPATRRAERAASIRMKYIPAGFAARQPLAACDKVLLGLRDIYTLHAFTSYVVSAGYSHLRNGQPNYGVNGEAFGERLGTAIVRDSTEGIFTDSVFAPLLHEDPRYYVEGARYTFIHRTLYAITRPLITRTDSGRASINGSLLLGYAAASALSYTYYPQINKTLPDTASTFGGAIGGAAFGFFVAEFSADVLKKLHLRKSF